MAGKWEGFSEEDIKNYLDTGPDGTSDKNSKIKVANLNNTSKQKSNVREKRLPQRKLSPKQSNIPEAALLLKSSDTSPDETTPTKDTLDSTEKTRIPLEPKVLITSNPARSFLEEKSVPDVVSPVSAIDTPESLEIFQARQKLLEEQNRQRKQFLTKLLYDRKKQTTEEARRLQNIQEELHKLDILLSNDVGILRDEIEVASMEFGEAQKRFNRAEKEFLEAKQNLFAKLERKELLTKHLCTIIEQNEVRKAQKLSELMNQLSASQLNSNINSAVAEDIAATPPTIEAPNTGVGSPV